MREESGDPQAAQERRDSARHLMMHPLTCAEQYPDEFRLIRRHHHELDQWFTQRLGYRLHLDADTARLFKSGIVPSDRPVRTRTGRPMHRRELQLLALVLASTAAGPLVVSLRDLVADVRSAATEAGTPFGGEASDRRELVTVFRWMIDRGLAHELHEQIDRYADDGDADAVLRIRPDRIALVPITGLLGESSVAALLARADRREVTRQWIRGHLAEDSVVYRTDLSDTEWAEFRRRLGEEARMLDEMFGLRLEARAEGVAAIDDAGSLSDVRFPTTGTVGHAALLLLDRLASARAEQTSGSVLGGHERLDVERIIAELAAEHQSHWSKDLIGAPERFVRDVLALLRDHRLVGIEGDRVFVLPAADRFATEPRPTGTATAVQEVLL